MTRPADRLGDFKPASRKPNLKGARLFTGDDRYEMRGVPLKLFLLPFSVTPTRPHTDSSCHPRIYTEEAGSRHVPAS